MTYISKDGYKNINYYYYIYTHVHLGIPDAPRASPYALEESERLLGGYERQSDWDSAFSMVNGFDPVRTSKLPRNDWYRLRRYLEVALTIRGESNSENNTGLISYIYLFIYFYLNRLKITRKIIIFFVVYYFRKGRNIDW